MRKLFVEALTVMENAFRRLEARVPPPIVNDYKDGFNFRYQERTIYQALIQKLARQISGLHAIDVLLLNGLVQEQGVIQRTLDEIGEDIHFLVLAITNDDVTPLHRAYLDAFWAEEFDHPDPMKSSQDRPMIPRKKIRAYNARLGGLADPSTATAVGRTIHKTYSGYVHAASPQIMDMCGGAPPRFFVAGMNGTPRIRDHVEDAWNHFYRGLLSVTMVAKGFGDGALVDKLYEYLARFEAASGTRFMDEARTSPV